MDPFAPIPVADDARYAARVYIGVTSSLFLIALATLLARIGFKLRAGVRFGWDDYLIMLGFTLAAADWIDLTVGIAWPTPSDKKMTTMHEEFRSIKLGQIGILLWGWACMFIKLSVLVLFLKLTLEKAWRTFLFSFLGFLTTVYLAANVFASLRCIPLAATWDPVGYPNAKCVGPNAVRSVSNFVGAFSIFTDIVLSLFPLTFLVKLRRPFLERALMSVLMGIGLTAAAMSIAKALYIAKWLKKPHSAYLRFMISTFSTAEMLIGSIAACLPCFKSTVQDVLKKCGLSFTSYNSNSPAFPGQNLSIQRHGLVPESVSDSGEEALREKGSSRKVENVDLEKEGGSI